MYFSKHNIFSKIKDSDNYFIVNSLTGNADILNPVDAGKVHKIKHNGEVDDPELILELQEKGYLIDETRESKLFRSKYLSLIHI